MIVLQYRFQGDFEDFYDEYYLLVIQSKQEQVCSNFVVKGDSFVFEGEVGLCLMDYGSYCIFIVY